MKTTRVLAAALAMSVLVVGCSDDDEASDASASEDTDAASDEAADDEGSSGDSITVTVSEDGIEVPAEATGGAVEVVVEGSEDEIDFSLVSEGTTEEQFIEGMSGMLEGGPAPDFLLGNAGVSAAEGTSTIRLAEGEYIVWTESGVNDGLAPEGTPPLFTAPLTVSGDNGGELPETDGTFTARDYEFDIDVDAGDTFTFENEGPDQLHHVILLRFGSLEPSVVEENFVELASSEGGEVPEAFAELDMERLEAGGSGVFSADGAGTFNTTLEAGTYVAACFISDKEGGPPHAIAHDMWQVFTIE